MKNVIKSLQNKDKRITKARRSIVDALTRNCSMTVDEMSQECDIRNISTVYRNLQVLRNEGFVTARISTDDKVHYALSSKKNHHHHLTCIACGTTKIVSLPDEQFIEKQFTKYNFRPIAHTIELEGLCKKCA